MSADKTTREDPANYAGLTALKALSEPQNRDLTASEPFHGLVIHEVTPGPSTSIEHPCFAGRHRWAYLTNGKVACGYCGTPRI